MIQNPIKSEVDVGQLSKSVTMYNRPVFKLIWFSYKSMNVCSVSIKLLVPNKFKVHLISCCRDSCDVIQAASVKLIHHPLVELGRTNLKFCPSLKLIPLVGSEEKWQANTWTMTIANMVLWTSVVTGWQTNAGTTIFSYHCPLDQCSQRVADQCMNDDNMVHGKTILEKTK